MHEQSCDGVTTEKSEKQEEISAQQTPPCTPGHPGLTLLHDEPVILCHLHLQLFLFLSLKSQLLLQPPQLKLGGLHDVPHG